MFVDPKLKLNLSTHHTGTPPWPTALALTLVVVALHGWLLAQGPDSVRLGAREALTPKVSLNTRNIVAEGAQAEPAAAAAKPAPPERKAASPNTLAMQEPTERGSDLAEAKPEQAEQMAAASPAEALADQAPQPSAPASSPSQAQTPPATAPASAEVVDPPLATATATSPTAAPAAAPSLAPEPTSPPVTPPAAERQLALAVPGSARLNYQLTGRARGFEYAANGQLDWQHDGQRYQARLSISGFLLPSRSQSSVGEIGPEGLSPRRYSDRARGELAVHFQPELGRISFSANSPPVAWQAGAQDRLSVTLQLAALLAGDPGRFSPGATVSMLTASSRNIEPWDFSVIGSESLSLPMGTQPALHLRRAARHPYDQTIDLWFAPALGYLPVRILLSQGNGDVVDQRLASIERP
jgi:hypothetical protein